MAESYEFKFKTTYTCGPKKKSPLESFEEIGVDESFYFHFNIAGDGRFIILRNAKQYPSFEKNKIYEVYHQNGGLLSATLNLTQGIHKYELLNETPGRVISKVITTLLVDLEGMTYIARTRHEGDMYKKPEVFKPSFGVCFDYKERPKSGEGSW